MGIFNPDAEQGIVIRLPYRPTDKVFYLLNGKIVQERIIKITTEHRSLVGESYQPATRITVLFESGQERVHSEVFSSKEELIASL